jgi:hypothetical protein
MIRKHFRFKRIALGLAFAGLVVPVSPAAAASLSTFVDGGPAPVSFTTASSYSAKYLRYHEVGGPIGKSLDIPSANALAQQPATAISERSNGVAGPDPSLVPQLAVSTSDGFDWSDAGIGASTTLGVALLLGVAVLFTRRNQRGSLTHA